MPSAAVVVETPIESSARVLQLRGLFDLPVEKTSRLEWNVDLPLEQRDWNLGLVVGPSGCGKSTLARELWPEQLAHGFDWPVDRSVVDGFPGEMGIKDVADLLSAVGFSSPPSWLRPFHCLSNGEQFRVTIARTLAEQRELAVIDEFTSVVDRTVAQIGSAAVAKTVRRRGQRLVAVTCHEDVEAWLTPDWTFRPATGEFTWGCLQRRPAIGLQVGRVPAQAWQLFRHHHYLDAKLNPSAVCFGAFYEGRLIAFNAWLPAIGHKGVRRASRIVCLPDFQGVGIGNALTNHCATMWRGLDQRALVTAAHPALIQACNRSSVWALTRAPKRSPKEGRTGKIKSVAGSQGHATRRLVASFEYVGEPLARSEAERLLRSRPDVEQALLPPRRAVRKRSRRR